MEVDGKEKTEIKSRIVDGLGTCVELPDKYIYLDLEGRDVVTERLPSIYFADWLETSKTTIEKIIDVLGIEGTYDEEFDDIVYPPLTFELVASEYSWCELVSLMDNHLTPQVMGELLNRDYRYVTKVAKSLGYRMKDGKFRKIALADIRDMERTMKYSEDWLTLRALSELSSMDREWVKNRLDDAGIIPEKRRSTQSGIFLKYYPPETLDYIKQCIKEIPKYGEDWYSCTRICEEVRKSRNWVLPRLSQYDSLAEIRQDDMGVGRLHYPKDVFEALLAEAEITRSGVMGDGWLTVNQVADLLSIDPKSVKRKLDKVGIFPEKRETNTGATTYHYNPNELTIFLSSALRENDDEIE